MQDLSVLICPIIGQRIKFQPEMQRENFTLIVPDRHSGKRLDQVLALLCPQHSRSRLQAWIRNGFVTVDGASLKQKDTIHGGQSIRVSAVIGSRSK